MKDRPLSLAEAIASNKRETNNSLNVEGFSAAAKLAKAARLVNTEKPERFPALVAKVIDDFNLIINRGSDHSISKGARFLVYYIDTEELIDPETKESLGHLEIIRGTGIATHVQEKMTTIKSNSYTSRGRTIRRQSGAFAAISGEIIEEPEKELLPFDEPRIGDKVKPI